MLAIAERHRRPGLHRIPMRSASRFAAPSTIPACRTCSAISRPVPTTTTSFATSTSRSIAAASMLRHRKGYLAAPEPARNSRARLDALRRVLLSPIEASAIASPRRSRGQERRARRCAASIRGADVGTEERRPRSGDRHRHCAEPARRQSIFTIKETTVNLTADPSATSRWSKTGLRCRATSPGARCLSAARRRFRRRLAVGRLVDYCA